MPISMDKSIPIDLTVAVRCLVCAAGMHMQFAAREGWTVSLGKMSSEPSQQAVQVFRTWQ